MAIDPRDETAAYLLALNLFLAGLVATVNGLRHDRRFAEPSRQFGHERALLVAVRLRDGRITAADVASAGPDTTVDEARQLLDDLAAEGLCLREGAPGEGVTYYFGQDHGAEPAAQPVPELRDRRLIVERAVLEAAVRRDGRVTPVQVAMAGGDVSLAEARDVLDELARDGHCAFESDERGAVYYDFNLGPVPLGEELTSDEWVDAMSARMSADDQQADAPLDVRHRAGG